MKKLKYLFLAVFSFLLLFACEKQWSEIDDMDLSMDQKEQSNKLNYEAHESAFKARFYTKKDATGERDPICAELDPDLVYTAPNFQEGGGNGTKLGKFTVTMQFCSGASGTYGAGNGTFVAANGDELWIDINEGLVYPLAGHELYEFQFQDPFTFVGGTGRFENASGGGMTNSFVDIFDDNGDFIPDHKTDHTWTGTISLK